MKRYVYIPLVTVMASCAVFKGGSKKSKKAAAPAPAATTATPANAAAKGTNTKTGVKPYASVVTKNLITQEGLFTVHYTKEMDSVLFEINQSLLGKDILVINRIKKAPGGLDIYPGEEMENNMIVFDKGPNDVIRMRLRLIISQADSTDAIFRSVKESNLDPILATFPIKAYGKDSASYVIDATKFLKDANSIVNSGENKADIKKFLDVKSMKDHEVTSLLAFPQNVEISISKNGTIRGASPIMQALGAGATYTGPATLETNTSFIALPEKPMQSRIFDPRVGYFADQHLKYGDDQQHAEMRKFVTKWRLEPKPEDLEKYKRGELVEPQQPIVLYIDPATPKQWRKYLILGVNDWQKAFEQAGFKNAISAKEWPENDTTMHMEDVRYSFINYFASPVSNAYGPEVHDPRTGQIIQTHIGWYHNVMQVLNDWYMIQAGPNDPMARKAKFDDELMGQLIRFVSSHEVGHTLGLRHNFGSSSQTPVDSLRSITWLKKHGHTASIMDYARFNYVAQPEDRIPQELLFPRIGEYDTWAIEWGYKFTGDITSEEDKKQMRKLVTSRIAANNLLWFGDGEDRRFDPRCQTEDLGDDAAKAGTYGIKNLKRVVEHLPEWTYEENALRGGLKNKYEQVTQQYTRYVVHVLRYIVAINYESRIDGDTRPSYGIIPKAKQLSALEWLNTEVFNTPDWLTNKKLLDMVVSPGDKTVGAMQISLVNSLLDYKRLNYMVELQKRYGKDALTNDEFFASLHKGVWSDLKNGSIKIDAFHRNMQKAYIGALVKIIKDSTPEISESEASGIASSEIRNLRSQIKQAIGKSADEATKAHLIALDERITMLYQKF
ncbi:DUF5117 domain-containing protein [Chitinophaga silvatica]|uniref:DUF5117 domain-containing protein n=1 Tax=Chitinophaga silvatica TaxID=2282649 RepID=A0A3E1YGW6_9BACT|nr:zinc-dependent metalloprotease [Chitinophaga silvatica]RFS26607.1 DUF5117 domain-containing protein [Chitinophaga silvatica]